jgi:glutamate-1-semialdehyde 2,1-aminomutase
VQTLPRGLCNLSSAHTLADIEATEVAIAAAVEAVAHAAAA